MYVRYVTAFCPKCFKHLMCMSRSLVELMFLAFCIACFVSCSETVTCVFRSFSCFCLLHCRCAS